MVEDKILIWRFKHGSSDALRHIYNKYEGRLLTLATALLIDLGDAEDAVHDVFVSFARSAGRVKVNGSLRSFLATCVVNRARNMIQKTNRYKSVSLDDVPEPINNDIDEPDMSAMFNEESRQIHRLLAGIPYGQREVIMLHVYEDMTFRQIAALQGASINTIQGRYRYGLDKLRSQLASEVSNEPSR